MTPDLYQPRFGQPGCAPFAESLQPACTLPADVPQEFRQVVELLADRRGQARALTARQIVECLGLWPRIKPGCRQRKLRQLIEHHCEAAPWPIVADTCGFYRVDSAEDVTHYDRNLGSRLRYLARRIAIHRRQARRAGYTYHGHGRWSEPQEGGEAHR